MLSIYCISTVLDSLCNFYLLASIAIWRIRVACKLTYKLATWSKEACDKSCHKSNYRIRGDGDRHEESHTISHYNGFIVFLLCLCFYLY